MEKHIQQAPAKVTIQPPAAIARCCAGILVIAVILAGASAHAQVQRGDFRVENLSFPGRQTYILPTDADLDGRADILVFHEQVSEDDAKPRRFFSVFYQKDAGDFGETADTTIEVAQDAAAFIVGDFAPEPGQEVAYICASGVKYYSPLGRTYCAEPKRLLFTRTISPAPQDDLLTLWQWPCDLDGNGMQDIILACPEGQKVFFQTAPGVFSRVCVLGVPVRKRVEGQAGMSGSTRGFVSRSFIGIEQAIPLPQQVHFNGDSRTDLAFLFDGCVSYFLQDPAGAFVRNPSGVLKLPLDRAVAGGNEMTATYASLLDVNNDGRTDLVLTKTRGDVGAFENMMIKTALFLNKGNPAFGDRPDGIISLKGSGGGPTFADLNADGYLDMIVSCLRTDMWGAVTKAILRSAKVSYYFFLFDPSKGAFSDSPDGEESVDIPVESVDRAGRYFPYLILYADYTGDKRPDMLRIDPSSKPGVQGELKMFPGRKGGGLRSEVIFSPDEYFVYPLAQVPDGVACYSDINGDGRADPILGFPDKVVLLISK
jgi:hypothetical protein